MERWLAPPPRASGLAVRDDPGRARRAADLRRRAEERLRNQAARADVASAAAASDRMAHELAVHQVEVELLTEALVEAEAEARLARERYQEIYDFAPSALLTLDRRGTIVRANLAAGNLLGFERARPLSRRLGSFVSEAQHAAFEGFLEAVFQRQVPCRCTVALVGTDGALRDVDLEATRSPDGVECSVVVTARAEREAEQQAAAAGERPAPAGHDADRMESLGALAGGIAHDFNNGLATILANVWLAQEELGPDHSAAESLSEIHAAGVRARDVVRQILTFSRRQPPELAVVRLGPVVTEAVRLLRMAAPAGVEIASVVDEHTPAVPADASQVHQVVMNLGTNALRAIADRLERAPGTARAAGGRVEVRVEGCDLGAAEARALPGSLQAGTYARISVLDDGVGMGPATRARAFEPFFTTHGAAEAKGLGLSVVHGIAATHGGAVTLESTPGTGTAARVYLPATAVPLTAETPHEGSPVPRTSSISSKVPHVICVDDEAAQVRAITMLLERDGCRATGYSDPGAALAAIRDAPAEVDVIVTDFNMPGTSGILLAREAMRIRANLPVILVSGNVTEGLRSEAKRMGVRQVIHKALVDELRSAVRRIVRPVGDLDDEGAETVG